MTVSNAPVQPTLWSRAPDANAPRISLAWISRPHRGEIESGDAFFVRERGNSVLITVVDALGHGPRAAEVARQALGWLASAEHTDAVALTEGLHAALKGSRGAAALVLVLSERGVAACSVGNVELRSGSGKLPFVLTPGVLGLRLRAPRGCSAPAKGAERLVLFSDGLSGRFDLKQELGRTPADLATHLFGKHRHLHDDATIVVLDYAF